jgi:hypothetical protein
LFDTMAGDNGKKAANYHCFQLAKQEA